jgi:hypothetical protein
MGTWPPCFVASPSSVAKLPFQCGCLGILGPRRGHWTRSQALPSSMSHVLLIPIIAASKTAAWSIFVAEAPAASTSNLWLPMRPENLGLLRAAANTVAHDICIRRHKHRLLGNRLPADQRKLLVCDFSPELLSWNPYAYTPRH